MAEVGTCARVSQVFFIIINIIFFVSSSGAAISVCVYYFVRRKVLCVCFCPENNPPPPPPPPPPPYSINHMGRPLVGIRHFSALCSVSWHLRRQLDPRGLAGPVHPCLRLSRDCTVTRETFYSFRTVRSRRGWGGGTLCIHSHRGVSRWQGVRFLVAIRETLFAGSTYNYTRVYL